MGKSWDARPGRPQRAARTGLLVIAGGASSAMNDSHEKYSGPEARRPCSRTAPCHGGPSDVNYSSLFTLHSSLLYHLPPLHDELDLLKDSHVSRWVTRDGDDIGIMAGFNNSDPLAPTYQVRRIDGC